MAAASTVAFKEGKKHLLELVKPPMKARGFAYLRELSFGRGSPEELQTVSFGARRGRGGEFCFSFGAGVRFPPVEALLRPENADDLVATIAKPLSILKPSTGFPEWCFDGQRMPEDVIGDVMRDIDEYALPFLETYSSMAVVAARLEIDDPRQWFVLTPEQRLMTLAALQHVQGRPEDALRRLDGALAEMRNAPMKKRWPLQKLRERLTSATSG